jgi:hypothetical protein
MFSPAVPHLRRYSTQLLVWYSQAVALYGLRNMHGHLLKHIGVKRTFTRSFERFSLLGSLIYTTSLFKTIHTVFGKTYFLFNLIYTLIYALFLYLSTLYNRGLPHPCQKREYARLTFSPPHARARLHAPVVLVQAWDYPLAGARGVCVGDVPYELRVGQGAQGLHTAR